MRFFITIKRRVSVMADTDVRRSPAVEKILQNSVPRDEPEVKEAKDSHKLARPHSSEAIMLDVMMANGSIESFPYAWLSRIRYQPGDTLTLCFGRNEIVIEGKNLARTRDLVSQHRSRFIQEGTEAEEGLKGEEAAHIDRIDIKEGDEE
jgi:hypothetical protein